MEATIEKVGTLGAHTGIPVRIADLVPFADRHCQMCGGAGERRVSVGTPDYGRKPTKSGKTRKSTAKKTVPCMCGFRRFMVVQRVAQDRKTGQIFFCEPVVAWSPAGQAIHKAAEADAMALAEPVAVVETTEGEPSAPA